MERAPSRHRRALLQVVTGPCTCAGGLAGKRSLSHLRQPTQHWLLLASRCRKKTRNYDESYEADETTTIDDPLGSCTQQRRGYC